MSRHLSRQIALMAVLATCTLAIVLIIALGLDASTAAAVDQALPLAVVLSAALTFLMADSFAS